MDRRQLLTGGLAAGCELNWPTVARADMPGKELWICFDTSASMYGSKNHWEIQRDGHIQALLDPEIENLLIVGRVQIRVILWSANSGFTHLSDGTRFIQSHADVEALTKTIKQKTLREQMDAYTDHAQLLSFCAEIQTDIKSVVIDVSSDEAPGLDTQKQCLINRAVIEARGWTINTLGIGDGIILGLEKFVQTSDGFTLAVADWHDYAEAIRRKILLEIS